MSYAMAISTRGLGRRYGATEAVCGLDLTVGEGEMFGFLGANGAGKSTTIAMLCTLLRPTRGSAEVAGADVLRKPDEVRRGIGVVFQEATADPDLTAEENLRFQAELYHVSRRERRTRTDHLLELLGLAGRRKSLVGTFSGGMRRRLEIARSLIHRPRVLFLDEPTAGLDPHSRAVIWEYLRELRRQQAITVFLTTHYLEEAENCDRVAVIDNGQLVTLGTPQELKSAVGADVIHLRTGDDGAAAQAVRHKMGLDVVSGPDGIRIRASDGAALVPRLCAELAVPIHSVMVTRPTLDYVFLHYTRGAAAGG